MAPEVGRGRRTGGTAPAISLEGQPGVLVEILPPATRAWCEGEPLGIEVHGTRLRGRVHGLTTTARSIIARRHGLGLEGLRLLPGLDGKDGQDPCLLAAQRVDERGRRGGPAGQVEPLPPCLEMDPGRPCCADEFDRGHSSISHAVSQSPGALSVTP